MFLRDARSQSTVRVLCNVAAGCSFAGLALLAEERRRRIALAQRIIENGRILQQYKSYHGVAPLAAFEPPSHSDLEYYSSYDHADSTKDEHVLTQREWASRRRKTRRLPNKQDLRDAPADPAAEAPVPKDDISREQPQLESARAVHSNSSNFKLDYSPMPMGTWNSHMRSAASRRSPPTPHSATTDQVAEYGQPELGRNTLRGSNAASMSRAHKDNAPVQTSIYHLDGFLSRDAQRAVREKRALTLHSVGTAIQRAVANRVTACLDSGDERLRKIGLAELRAYFHTFDLPVESSMLNVLKTAHRIPSNRGTLDEILAKVEAGQSLDPSIRPRGINLRRSVLSLVQVSSMNDAASLLEKSMSIGAQMRDLLHANKPGLAYMQLVSQWPTLTNAVNEGLETALQDLISIFSRLRCFSIVQDLQARYIALFQSAKLLVKDAGVIVRQLLSGDVHDLCTFAITSLDKNAQVDDAMDLVLVYCRNLIEYGDWRDACRLLTGTTFVQPCSSLVHMAKLLQSRCVDAQEQDSLERLSNWLSDCGSFPSGTEPQLLSSRLYRLLVSGDIRQAKNSLFLANAPLIETVKAFTSEQTCSVFQAALEDSEYSDAIRLLEACLQSKLKLNEESFTKMAQTLGHALQTLQGSNSSKSVLRGLKLLSMIQRKLFALAPSWESMRIVEQATRPDEVALSAVEQSIKSPMDCAAHFHEPSLSALYSEQQYRTIVQWAEHIADEATIPDVWLSKIYHAYAEAGNTMELEAGLTRFGLSARQPNASTPLLLSSHKLLLERCWELTESFEFVRVAWKTMERRSPDNAYAACVLDTMMSIALQARQLGPARKYMSLRLNPNQPGPSVSTYGHIALLHAQRRDWTKVNEVLEKCRHLDGFDARREYSSIDYLVREACLQLEPDAALEFVAQLEDRHGFALSTITRNQLLGKLIYEEDIELVESWFLWLVSRKHTHLEVFTPSLSLILHRIERPYEHIYTGDIGAGERLSPRDVCRRRYALFRQQVVENTEPDRIRSEQPSSLLEPVAAGDAATPSPPLPSTLESAAPLPPDRGEDFTADSFDAMAFTSTLEAHFGELLQDESARSRNVPLAVKKRNAERRMLLRLASREFDQVVQIYRDSLVDGLPTHAVDLAVAVTASARATGSSLEAQDLIAEARARHLNVARAQKALRIFEARNTPDLSEHDARVRILAAYRLDREQHLPPDHHHTLAVLHHFIGPAHGPTPPLRLFQAVRAEPESRAVPFDLPMLTLQMQAFIGMRHAQGIAWASAAVCGGAHRIDKRYIAMLKYRRWWHRKQAARLRLLGHAARAEDMGRLHDLLEGCADDAKRVYERQHRESWAFARRFVELVDRHFPRARG